MLNTELRTACFFVLTLAITSCSTNEKKHTLAELDVSDSKNTHATVFVKPKSEAEIKKAYYEYIRNASQADQSRQAAINRIAAMELNLTNKILADSDSNENEDITDRLYLESLEKAANLLSTSLRDFPDAPNNDNTLYQLSRTQDQLGRGDLAVANLKTLVSKYPESPFYAEAQFRLAEHAFVSGDYITAEDAYTEVILTSSNDRFYEKSLFKRGWTRYKQELYDEAVDDYLQALTYHRFADIEKLNKTERDQFDEYFRAIGLVFSHLRGARSLNEYFADQTNFKYLYHTYTVVADIYVKQERFSDAAETMKLFVEDHPSAVEAPLAQLNMVTIWQQGNFTDRLHEQIEVLYTAYNPTSPYWKENPNNSAQKEIQNTLRDYIVKLAAFHHSQYQKNGKKAHFNSANIWYSRYINHYEHFARQDKIYARYGDLLASGGMKGQALSYYEKAAYDGELVLDKKAAYATATLSNELYNTASSATKPNWLAKHTEYAYRYASLYPEDPGVGNIIANAAQLSFAAKDYERAIKLTQLYKPSGKNRQDFVIGNIKARSFLDSGDYTGAESAFTDLLTENKLSSGERKKVQDSIALSIYKRGEQAKSEGDIESAVHHFGRIVQRYPQSAVAATGLYDAASLSITNELWGSAIFYYESFQQLFPKHKYNKEATRQLSVAYLKSNQKDKAAKQFEQLARGDESREVKMAALWQAAQLYDERKDIDAAIRSYREYAHAFKEPYPQNMEAMHRLTALYKQKRDSQKRYFWQTKIKNADARASQRVKTDRTNFIASSTVLELAEQQKQDFTRTRLVEPLAANLKKKKKQMQAAIKLYGQASAYKISEVTTQSTFQIADIYQTFSVALLESERPSHLNGDELEQYNILLEDQAFPFEEKAIEFYETNLSRVKDDTYDQWISTSHQKLIELFPVRFDRKVKVEAFYNE